MRKWTFLCVGALTVGLAAAGYALVNGDEPAATKAAPAAAGPAKNRITKVTVYPTNALVTREVEVPPGNGLTELVVADLPVEVTETSIYSESSDGLRVLSTRFRTRPVFEDVREDVRKLEDQKEKLTIAAQKLNAEITTTKANMETLNKLEMFTSKTAVASTEKGSINGDTIITMIKYVMEQRGEKAKELLALEQQLDVNKKEAHFVEQRLGSGNARPTRMERDAVIVVDRENGAGGRVRFNYLVNGASWHPQYKLRAGAKAQDPVQLDYLASIVQKSGEDWNNVSLTLSTAQPMLNAAPPELKKLEVAVVALATLGGPAAGHGAGGGLTFAPQPAMDLQKKATEARGQAQNFYANQDVRNASKFINDAAAWEQQRELMKSREEVAAEFRSNTRGTGGNEGPSVTYHLKSRLSVPSRHDEQVIEVAKITLEPKYYYKAVPVLARHVYRLADLTNKSEHVLLPGEATMYQGTDFVGRMTMPLVAIGEEFTAGFGVDPQLQIQRQMMDKTKATQGGNQVLNYKYRILVSSYKGEAVKVQVWDRLPLAENDIAGVTLTKATPEVSKDGLYEREQKTQNLLRWDMDVEPAMNGERAMAINYEFRLELDRNMAISGLLTR